MSEPFLAEIRIVGFDFAPRSWAFCDGQILPINQNQSLYSLLGTTYGGDGRTSFGLPELRGRAPMHAGSGPGLTARTLGARSGEEIHTLSTAEMPAHSHGVTGRTADATSADPGPAHALARVSSPLYGDTPTGELAASSLTATGGGQAHENMQPYLALRFCIALQGLFPSRN